MKAFPQKLINVTVPNKPDLEEIPKVQNAIEAAEKELGKQGRVLIRYSGTQPMCRVMVEGPTEELTNRLAQSLADTVKKAIG